MLQSSVREILSHQCKWGLSSTRCTILAALRTTAPDERYRAYGAECLVYDHRSGTQTRSRRAYAVGVAQSPIEGVHVLNDLTFDQQIVHEATFTGDALPTPMELIVGSTLRVGSSS